MKIESTDLADVLIIEPRVFSDERGYFFESWNQREFSDAVGHDIAFVQDNESMSSHGVLRGIHYQAPNPQGKLVRVTRGTIWDVAVDLRRSSPSFLQWVGVELSDQNHRQLWIPEGFGHGFVATSDLAVVAYKTSAFFDADGDRAIRYDDPSIGVQWPQMDFVISAKDRMAPTVEAAVVYP